VTTTYSHSDGKRGGSGAARLVAWTSIGFVATMLVAPWLKRKLAGKTRYAKFEMPADMQAVIPTPPSYVAG